MVQIAPEGLYTRRSSAAVSFEYLELSQIELNLEKKPKDVFKSQALAPNKPMWSLWPNISSCEARVVVKALRDGSEVRYVFSI